MKRGIVTACEEKIPKWSFVVRDAVFRVDSHITSRNTTLRVKKLPVFFFPFLIAPTTERSRQSGFLLPHISNSSVRGRSFGDAFYLTLGRSADLLTRSEYFSLRGIAGEVEFRALPTANTHIYMQGLFANEYLQPESSRHNGESLRILADTSLESGYRAVADIDLISSQAFRQYYGDSFATITRPDKISTTFVSRNFDAYSLNFLGERRLNRFSGDGTLPTHNVIIRTLPGIDFSGQSQQIGNWPAYYNFDVALDGMGRSTMIEGDGALANEIQTPPLVGRLDLYPHLIVPFTRFRQWSWTQRLALRETYYSARLDPSAVSGTTEEGISRTAFSFQSDWVDRKSVV
jgi:LPS-assembly protein